MVAPVGFCAVDRGVVVAPAELTDQAVADTEAYACPRVVDLVGDDDVAALDADVADTRKVPEQEFQSCQVQVVGYVSVEVDADGAGFCLLVGCDPVRRTIRYGRIRCD